MRRICWYSSHALRSFTTIVLLTATTTPLPSDDFTSDNTGLPQDVDIHECQCWKWPGCISNCTATLLLKEQLQTHYSLLESLSRPFAIIFPYQDRKLRSSYGTSTAGKRGSYFTNTKFWIHLPTGQHVQLKLQKSGIFDDWSSYSTLYYKRTNKNQLYPFASDKLDHCFYTGSVRQHASNKEIKSFVAVDTCHGLRGLIQIENQTYGVLPLTCKSCQVGHLPHVIFANPPTPIEREAIPPTFWQPTDVKPRRRAKTQDEARHVVRLVILLDHHLFITLQEKLEQCLHYIGSIINQATKSFQGLPIDLKLVQSEIWNVEDRIHLNSSIKTTLNNLAFYIHNQRQSGVVNFNKSHSEHPHVFLLLTTAQFTDPVEYLPVPDSICTVRSLGVIQVNMSETVYHISRLLSLSIAEILGLKSFPCPPHYSCSSEDILSAGDVARIHLALFTGIADCLLGEYAGSEVLRIENTCGNGLIDRGEECDPGETYSLLPSRSMPCCNPHTCLVDLSAVCTHGGCCDQCRPVSRGQLCRHARDQCDIPEFCTGDQPSCPADLYLENGTPCQPQMNPSTSDSSDPMSTSIIDETAALCYLGRCPTRSSQCRLIWGQGASKGADYCFLSHNTRTAGACGIEGQNCNQQHAMCGLLHCRGGESRPVAPEAQEGQPFLTYTEHGGEEFECKHLSHRSIVRFVPEGAACAQNQYCFQHQCVSPSVALRSRCSSPTRPSHDEHGDTKKLAPSNLTCSGHGICTNVGFCLCRPSWTGDNCEIPISHHRTIQSKSPSKRGSLIAVPDADITAEIWKYLSNRPLKNPYSLGRKEGVHMHTIYLIGILGAVVGGMFILLGLFMMCYRRNGRVGFARKHSTTHCWFTRSKKFSLAGSTSGQNSGSNRVYDNSMDLKDLQYLGLSPNCLRSTPGRHSDGKHSGRRHSKHGDKHHDDRHLKYHGHRRRKKPCHEVRSEDVGHRRRRRSRKHGALDSGAERSWLTGCVNHSDTELACRQSSYLQDLGDSIDRIIKFGSMPSYRDDKRSKSKDAGVISTHSLELRSGSSPLSSQPPLPVDPTLPVTSETNSKVLSSSPCTSPPPILSNASDAPCDSGHSIAADDRTNAKSTCSDNNKSTVFGVKPMDSTSTVPMPSMNDALFNIVMENSWRQPEKGILKNRNEIGSANNADQSHPHQTHKRRHRRRRSFSRHNSDRQAQSTVDNCASRSSVCSECSLCASAADDRIGPVRGRSRSVTDTDLQHSNSASGSSTSQSSTSSSFSALDNPDMTTSSSTTSTCSTALEVGPDGLTKCNSRQRDPKEINGTSINLRPNSDSENNNFETDGRRRIHNCQRHHHHHSRKHHGRHARRHSKRCHHESTPSTPASTPTSMGTAFESSESSHSGTNPASSGLSGASSSSSCAAERHVHRRHRHLRIRRSTDEDATTSGSHRSSPLPTAPTILCNAGQQTDEMSLLKAAGLTIGGNTTKYHPTNEKVDSADEWEEVECSESACEECQLASHKLMNTTSSKPPINAGPNLGVYNTGHTNPAFHANGDTNISTPSIACQQQSTASSSLGSSHNSKMGTLTMQPNPQSSGSPVFISHNNANSPQGSAVGMKFGHVANRATSSSSCSSNTTPGHLHVHADKSMRTKINQPEEFKGQPAEIEMDGNWQLMPGHLHHMGPLYSPSPSVLQHPMSFIPQPVPMPSYGPGQTRPPMNFDTSLGTSSPLHASGARQVIREISYAGLQSDGMDNYYQHPYEEVANDDYMEAMNGRDFPNQHIYHEHGRPIIQPGSPSSTACVYSKGDDDEEERLSLDEDLLPNGNSSVQHTSLFAHQYNLPTPNGLYTTNIHDNSVRSLSTWNDHKTGYVQHIGHTSQESSYDPMYRDRLHTPSTCDMGIESDLSVYPRRDDIHLDYAHRPNFASPARLSLRPLATTTNNHNHEANLRPSHLNEARSNEGTCAESDTSSLPESSCDLVQLAQLEVPPGRPNAMLNKLARQQVNTQWWLNQPISEDPNDALETEYLQNYFETGH